MRYETLRGLDLKIVANVEHQSRVDYRPYGTGVLDFQISRCPEPGPYAVTPMIQGNARVGAYLALSPLHLQRLHHDMGGCRSFHPSTQRLSNLEIMIVWMRNRDMIERVPILYCCNSPLKRTRGVFVFVR